MRRIFDSPLGRYAFPAVGASALANGQLYPALLCAAVTIYAWKVHHR